MTPDTIRAVLQASWMLPTAQPAFHLLGWPEDGVPWVETFTSLEALREQLTSLMGNDVALFIFMGWRFQITKGPLRHLLTPVGNFPLFEGPGELEVEDDGFVGRRPAILAVPESPEELADDDDAEEDEEEAGTHNTPVAGADGDVGTFFDDDAR